MARYSDETGVPNTCPLIDEVEGGLIPFLLNKYNSGITEVVEGVDFHIEKCLSETL